MNKNLSIALNLVLVIAVAVLYYLHFSCDHKAVLADGENNDSTAVSKPIVMMPKEIKASKIVYVNTDILNEKYEYVKDLTNVAKANLQSLESAYKKKADEFQTIYGDFQQKASQGLLSENQTKAAQEELGKRKQELEEMEGRQQQMMEKVQVENEKVFKAIMDYIREYNKNSQYNYVLAYSNKIVGSVLLANDSLDITNEIVAGLNAQYKARKGK